MNDAELIATAALVIADVAEAITANQDRAQTGQAMAYGGFHPNPHAEILAAELARRGVRIYPGGPGELDPHSMARKS